MYFEFILAVGFMVSLKVFFKATMLTDFLLNIVLTNSLSFRIFFPSMIILLWMLEFSLSLLYVEVIAFYKELW